MTRKFSNLFLVALSLVLAGSLALAQLAGSPHDFSRASWNPSGDACIVCHSPHSPPAGSGNTLLWNRRLSNAVYTVYRSDSLHATPGAPEGSSKLCLSCHDGTVAVDSFGDQAGSTFITGKARLGTDLSSSHPIAFLYDSALAGKVKTLHDPAAAPSGLGGTIAQDMLRDGKVECVSCHDVHNRYNQPHLLIKSNRRSALCFTCHNL